MKVFNTLKPSVYITGILFTLFVVTDLVSCQGGGMGSGVEGGMGAATSMGGGIGGGMNGGMGGESMGQGSGMGHGHGPPQKMPLPGRNFHAANSNPRGLVNVAYPEYTQRNKRSILTEAPIKQNSDDNIPDRNKRYTVLVMPHKQNHLNSKKIQNFNKENQYVGVTKQFGRFEEILNEKVIFQMRSKRTPEQTPEGEEGLEIENDNYSSDDVSYISGSSSSSYSDSNEEYEQDNNNEKNNRNRRRAVFNGRNSEMHSIPVMEINKQSIIRKSFDHFVH